MNSQPSASPSPVEHLAALAGSKSAATTGTGEAEGLLFPPEEDGLIRSVLDLTRELERLGYIEIIKQPSAGDAYRIIPKRRGKPSRFHANELAQRVGAIFGRRPTTPWAKDEIEAFKVVEFDPEDLELVEAYYKSEAKKPEAYCRTRLLTFLRHYPGEVDRARRWQDNSSKRHSY